MIDLIDTGDRLSFMSRKHQSEFFFDQYNISMAEQQENTLIFHVDFDTKVGNKNDKNKNKLLSYS